MVMVMVMVVVVAMKMTTPETKPGLVLVPINDGEVVMHGDL